MMFGFNPQYGFDMSFFGFILLFVVVVIPVVLACLFLVFLLVRKPGNGGPPRVKNADETRLIQEIHQGLLTMEQRIEALETIVLEAGERS